MPKYEMISTDTWKVRIPTDWSEQSSSAEGVFYLESEDHTKGGYFSTLCFLDDSRSAREILVAIHHVELRSLHEMKDKHWEIICEWNNDRANESVLGMDVLDRTTSYRIVCQLICHPPWVVRMALHDYDCTDYQASKQYFQPLIDSLEIHMQE
jgi:hypothetical protein